MKRQEKEMYQYLEDLKLLCVLDETVYIRHLREVFGLSYDDAFKLAIEFTDDYENAYKKYGLDDLFPSLNWLERQERLAKNKDKADWVLARIGDVKLTEIMKEFKISRNEAIELIKDAVLGYGVLVSRMQFVVTEYDDDSSFT